MVTDRMRMATLTDIKRHTVTDIYFLILIYPCTNRHVVAAPWRAEEELKASRRPLSASESRTLTNATSSGQNARRPWSSIIAPRSSGPPSIRDGSEQVRPSHAPRDRSRYIGSESHGPEEQRHAKTLTTQILSRVAPRGLRIEHSFAKKFTGSLKAKGGARGTSPGKLRELTNS